MQNAVEWTPQDTAAYYQKLMAAYDKHLAETEALRAALEQVFPSGDDRARTLLLAAAEGLAPVAEALATLWDETRIALAQHQSVYGDRTHYDPPLWR